MIRLDKLSKSYQGRYVVQGIDLHVRAGELVALLGGSGCGKTTTLKMINRLIEPTSGTVHVDGVDVATRDPIALRRSIGYVFQGVGLFPHMTVAENTAMVPKLLGWSDAETRARVDELLTLVELPPATFRDRMPAELSGGQRQRVGVARALAARAKVVLMDEPFGALDPITRDTLQLEYRRLHDQLGLTAVLVTHDMMEALLLADRIAIMDAGAIVQCDTPARILADPATDFVADMVRTPQRQLAALERAMDLASASGAASVEEAS